MLASGFSWTEGPLWSTSERALYFTDTVAANIYRWSEAGGVALHVSQAGGFDGANVSPSDYARLAEPGSNGMACDVTDPVPPRAAQSLEP